MSAADVLGWVVGTSSGVTASAVTAGVTLTVRGVRAHREEHEWLLRTTARNTEAIEAVAEEIRELLKRRR